MTATMNIGKDNEGKCVFISKTKHMLLAIILFALLVASAYFYCYCRWKYLWALEGKKPYYEITQDSSEGLRVVMIGDSWAEIHHELMMDLYLTAMLEKLTRMPVVVSSKGKGGEKTRGVYRLMFEDGQYGTKPLLSVGPKYCVVIAGINDAAANLGSLQYCHYYMQILEFLMANHIKPIIVEIPNVDLWHLYGEKPFVDLAADYLKSTMTGCGMYHLQNYRESLYKMLMENHFIGKILYVRMKDWNDRSPDIDKQLFMTDQVHLNRHGYEKLDSCIALAIAEDLKKAGNSDFVN